MTWPCSHPPVGSDDDGTEAADFDIHREPEADEPAFLARLVALGFQRVPVRRLQRRVERLVVVTRVVDRAHLRLIRELVRLDEVPPPQLGRIHLQLAREHVHRALDEVGRFGTAGAAIGVGRRLVGEDLGQRRANRRDVVGPVRHQHRQRRDRRRQQHVVGADVGDQPHLQAEHLAVLARRDVDVAEDVAPVRGRDERFGSILDPLDRHAELLRHHRADVLLGVDVDLRAEAAADFRRDGADLVLAEAVHRRDHRLQDVRVLRRRPDGHRLLARLPVRQHAARLHRVRHQAMVDHALADHHLGVGERLVDGGVVDRREIRRDTGAARHQRDREVVREVLVDHAGLPVIASSGSTTAGSGSYEHDDRIGGVARR